MKHEAARITKTSTISIVNQRSRVWSSTANDLNKSKPIHLHLTPCSAVTVKGDSIIIPNHNIEQPSNVTETGLCIRRLSDGWSIKRKFSSMTKVIIIGHG